MSTGERHGDRLRFARALMTSFVERTGLTGDGRVPKRYLWTDAFAVCNLLELAERTGDVEYRSTALRLVDQVHRTLGRHREDDPRSGWISGLTEAKGTLHPTRGGLRIGKELPERRAEQSFDERLEWERDGQYFHYLTKWMHALARVADDTDDFRYLEWAIELAQAAYAGFVHVGADGHRRLFWKMSIDLSRPLVPSMGHHDPLDGQLTFRELRMAAARSPRPTSLGNLDVEIAALEELGAGTDWATADPLGLGGLLADAYRSAELIVRGASTELALPGRLLEASVRGLRQFVVEEPLAAPATHRLAFRELGLAIGLAALPRMRRLVALEGANLDPGGSLSSHLAELESFAPLGERIIEFWLLEGHRAVPGWTDHRDINDVMLATSLTPDEFLRV